MARTAVVFAGAPVQPTDRLRARLAGLSEPFIVAADSGAAGALAFGLVPDLVIGDLDSLPPAVGEELRVQGVPFEIYARAKDATDSQLALQTAMDQHPEVLLLLGFVGGPRLDMTLANVLLLSLAPSGTLLLDEHNECMLLRGQSRYQWQSEAHELISLLPLAGNAEGVRTEGMRYPLDDEPLRFGDSRGVSNEPVQREVSVSLGSGELLIVRHFPRL